MALDIMQLEDITPDEVVLWSFGPVELNATIVFTWLVMALLVLIGWLAGRSVSEGESISRLQNLLEVIIGYTRDQIRDISQDDPDTYLPFIGTIFLFIALSNLLAVVPGFVPPTASLSTTAALALLVMVSVVGFGIAKRGVGGYLKNYIQPTFFMLPFNIIGEFSRTLALAVRLFGNIMSGAKIGAILLAVAPLIFPVLMHLLGLLTGMLQAYIFAILAMVYIGSATRRQQDQPGNNQEGVDNG
ncbi:F0F1 ATP synthase subunit A [Salidesulfovibrio brasiliensis]|uniref:F0F1 ATP synthase subunit A n=1 Tax=Salidesulfovibrio brasiliensis TaxID=221711 RepID=UPI000AEBC2FF|nr:F0F1 ATP synthase subunit A [Salidesulfovibrio brasiliensis]